MWQYTVEPRFLDKTGAVWRQYINIIRVDVVDSQVFKKVKKGHIPAIKTKSKGIEWKSLIFKWQRRREKRKPSSQKSHPSHPNNKEQSLSLSLFNRPFFSLLWFALSRSRSRSLCPWVFYRALLTQSHPLTDSFSSSRSPNCKSFFPLISNPNFSILLLLSKIPNFLFIYL